MDKVILLTLIVFVDVNTVRHHQRRSKELYKTLRPYVLVCIIRIFVGTSANCDSMKANRARLFQGFCTKDACVQESPREAEERKIIRPEDPITIINIYKEWFS